TPSTSTLFPYTTLFRSSSFFKIFQAICEIKFIVKVRRILTLIMLYDGFSLIKCFHENRFFRYTLLILLPNINYLLTCFRWQKTRSEEHTSELQSRFDLV